MRHMMRGVLLVAVALLTSGIARADDTKARRVEVVICIDTSNSMDGLIASAKAKLWDIVNDLAKLRPAPDLRVALYSYGNDSYDRNAGWVRKELDLTNDLDILYQKLNALTTNGGTEYATRVCRDALVQQPWSKDNKALKLIFVCGNEPASQDKSIPLATAAALSKEHDVVINPIFCGPADHRDANDWKDFATLCRGRFMSIDQNRGTVAIVTPMDKEMVALSEKLNTTYVRYGKEGEVKARNQVLQDAAAASNNAAAARGAAKGSVAYNCADWDLVDRCRMDPKFDIKILPESELTEEMRKMTPAEREAHVKKMAETRAGIQKQVQELQAKREAYIAEVRRKTPSAADKAFDEAVRGVLREQAAAKGFTNMP